MPIRARVLRWLKLARGRSIWCRRIGVRGTQSCGSTDFGQLDRSRHPRWCLALHSAPRHLEAPLVGRRPTRVERKLIGTAPPCDGQPSRTASGHPRRSRGWCRRARSRRISTMSESIAQEPSVPCRRMARPRGTSHGWSRSWCREASARGSAARCDRGDESYVRRPPCAAQATAHVERRPRAPSVGTPSGTDSELGTARTPISRYVHHPTVRVAPPVRRGGGPGAS